MTSLEKNLFDLDWCLSSAMLMAPMDKRWQEPEWFNHLPQTTEVPEPGTRSHRLGIRFEDIICHWIEATPGFELLARNLPVHDGKRTIGEFDVIVRHKEQIEHWELAIKFYLGLRGHRNLNDWHGPEPSDTLATKYNRVRDHQLRLSDHPAATALLAENGWKISQTRAFMKGRLFHPYDDFRNQRFHCPVEVNPHHEKGWWIMESAFEVEKALQDGLFIVLEKPDWLAPIRRDQITRDQINTDKIKTVRSQREITDYLAKEARGGTLHIARLDDDLNEISRGFVVRQSWLDSINP